LATTVAVWKGKRGAFAPTGSFSSGFNIGGPLQHPDRAYQNAPPAVPNPGNLYGVARVGIIRAKIKVTRCVLIQVAASR
jgi:hypothetical protein